MKKFITNTLVLILVCLSCVMPVKADTSKVKVTIPTFKVTLNGQLMDNQYNQYPLLVYKGITYFPMTYYGSRFLGLRANWYQNAKYYGHESVLFVGVCSQSEKQAVLKVTKNKRKNLRSYTASVANYGLALNTTTADQFINNATEKYPILNFRGISYFPLTWKYAVDEFGWQYSYDNKNGLVINSGDAVRPIVDDSIIGRSQPSEDVKNETLNTENIKDLVVNFINTTLSDFATIDTYQDGLIDDKAILYRQFLKDKREVGNIKQKSKGKWTLVQSEVKNFSYKELKENLYEVICTFQRRAVIGDKKEELTFEEGYKLLILNNNGKMNVIAGMDSSLSTIPLFPRNVATLAKDLDLSLFVSKDFSLKTQGNLPYDMNDIKSRLEKE